jgi:hypothetical protein
VAFYHSSPERIMPRNGTAPCRDAYPLSYTVYGPAELPQSMDNPGTTNPSDGFRAAPQNDYMVRPSFGRHDGLHGRLMEVAQADLYMSAVPGVSPYRAGTWEEPGGPIAASMLVRLAPTTSAHHGLAQATGPGPTMIFTAPPVFSVQSVPIYALGL